MRRFLPVFIFTFFIFFLFTGAVIAAEPNHIVTLEDTIRANSVTATMWGTITIAVFVLLTVFFQNSGSLVKKILFTGIALPTLVTTIFLAGSTIYLNFNSSSHGPVHWHADFEIYNCGQKLDLLDPKGFSNKIGTATYHEHNDNRIHLEGVVVKPEEASLGRFFDVIGGKLDADVLNVPTNNGDVSMVNGGYCGTDLSYVQVFVYKTSNDIYTQSKLENPTSYVLSPYGNVPDGDCIIIEYAPLKEKTDYMCQAYRVKEQLGEIKNGN